MKYAIEMGSGAIIYIPSFIKISSAIQNFMGRNTRTHRQHGDRISLLLFFFQNEESRRHPGPPGLTTALLSPPFSTVPPS
jgi:hypothetical protein